MGIQSSINSLLSQTQRLATFYTGLDKAKQIIRGQEAQKEATKSLQESFEKRYRNRLNLPDNVVLRPEQRDIVNIGTELEEGMGRAVDIDGAEYIHNKTKEMGFKNIEERQAAEDATFMSHIKNEVARNLAKSRVKARTDSINKTKSNFDAHTASLNKKYGKGVN